MSAYAAAAVQSPQWTAAAFLCPAAGTVRDTAGVIGPPANPTFYDRVYELVRQVPRGRVITYGHVALLLGAPSAARAVGYALHNLPAESDVPWWRVINARGTISLKDRGSNAELQRALLEHEGVQFDLEGRISLETYRWWPEQERAGR